VFQGQNLELAEQTNAIKLKRSCFFWICRSSAARDWHSLQVPTDTLCRCLL